MNRLGFCLAAMLGVILCLGAAGHVLPAAHGQTTPLQDFATGKLPQGGKGIAALPLIAPDLRTLVSVDPKAAVVKVWDTAAGAVQLPKDEPAARAADIKDYLAKDGNLKEKLTLTIREGGGGISGA